MSNRKQRDYPDYVELGRLLYDTDSLLSNGIVKAGSMFPVNSKHIRCLQRIKKGLNQLRSDIDEDYCREFPDRESPSGDLRFPIYPGPNRD